MTKDEALKMCLEYIETDAHERKYVRHAIKEALAQPEQKRYWKRIARIKEEMLKVSYEENKLLKEALAQRTWVGLTDEEAMQICVDCGCMSEDWLMLLDAIEAKLKEKNT